MLVNIDLGKTFGHTFRHWLYLKCEVVVYNETVIDRV